MLKKQFAELVQLTSQNEVEKATLLAFYFHKIKNQDTWTVSHLGTELVKMGFSKPNSSRLKAKLISEKAFVKVDSTNIKLHLKKLELLEKKFPQISSESEEIVTDDTVLPENLYSKTRGYIESVSKQINACYQHHLYDGCAMLMRRLMEMLIILTYKKLGRESETKDSNGHSYALSSLINYSIQNKVLGLTKDSESMLDEFRVLGNYSAHGLEYSCRKGDLKKIRIQYRACIEELLYKSGVKK